MSARRVQMEPEARQISAIEINDMCEEPLQEKPLPKDVHLQEVQPETVFGAV